MSSTYEAVAVAGAELNRSLRQAAVAADEYTRAILASLKAFEAAAGKLSAIDAPKPADKAISSRSPWQLVVAKRQASFAERPRFQPGSNRDIIYGLLQRAEGVSLAECSSAIRNKKRALTSLLTDLQDIAVITQRRLDSREEGGGRRYWLLPHVGLGSVPPGLAQRSHAQDRRSRHQRGAE